MTHALSVVHDGEPGTALARPSIGLLRPIAPAAEVLVAQELTRELVTEALKEGRDYGNIPGVDKPSLLKPGAERVSLAFGCTARFHIVSSEIDHDREVAWTKTKWVKKDKPGNWEDLKAQGLGRNRKFDGAWVWQEKVEERGTSLGLYRYVVECEIVHRESGQVVGSCVGSCSSLESKYIDRPRDTENTIIKMAEKRAFVGATLTTFGLSEQFTQDVEDLPRDQFGGAGAEDEQRDRPTDGATRGDSAASRTANGTTSSATKTEEPSCPQCSGPMWDNRVGKTNPKAPDYKCKKRGCDGVYWPGAWPPAPPASDAQRAQMLELASSRDLNAKQRTALDKALNTADKPLNAQRAQEWIDKLKELPEKTAEQTSTFDSEAEAKVGAKVTNDTSEFDGLPF